MPWAAALAAAEGPKPCRVSSSARWAASSSVSSVGSLILQNFMNGFGTQTVAAVTTAYRVDSIVMVPILNLGSGISTLVAQNCGAGQNLRARSIFRVGTAVMAAVSPAVVVPRMVRLMDEGYGVKQGIPQLILAGASVDDVYVIVLFSTFVGMMQGESASLLSFVRCPFCWAWRWVWRWGPCWPASLQRSISGIPQRF